MGAGGRLLFQRSVEQLRQLLFVMAARTPGLELIVQPVSTSLEFSPEWSK
jgi:hypothetical protein